MTLTEAIVALALKFVDGTNSWYKWKGLGYAQTIALKQQMHERWQQNDDPSHRKRLVREFLGAWGGIRTNSPTTIAEYALRPPEELIATYGAKGIASWSKVLVLRDPAEYAIYDSRVAASLNSLQKKLHDTEGKVWFPDVPGRPGKKQEQVRLLKKHAQESNWKYASGHKFPGFYKRYLAMLHEVVRCLQDEGRPTDGIATVEMLLFSQAEDLL